MSKNIKTHTLNFLFALLLSAFSVATVYAMGSKSDAEAGKKVFAVHKFNVEKYLGKWYEIARLNHSFEEGLSKVSATYTLNDDGTIKVLNRGYNKEKGTWKDAEGKAKFKFKDRKDLGYLRVSFFGPFYSDYKVIKLALDYSYAVVAGGDFDYFWILSRTQTISDELLSELVMWAEEQGFDLSDIIILNEEFKE